MMELTEEERARWKQFKEQCSKKEKIKNDMKTAREGRIVELSRRGASIRQIKEEVGGAGEIIMETRMGARRKGMY